MNTLYRFLAILCGMTAGVYILRLINGNEVKTQKIVIE